MIKGEKITKITLFLLIPERVFKKNCNILNLTKKLGADLHNLQKPEALLPGTFVKIMIWQAHFEQIHINFFL